MPNIRKNLCVNSKNTFGDTKGQAEGWMERQTLIHISLLAMAGGPIKHLPTFAKN